MEAINPNGISGRPPCSVDSGMAARLSVRSTRWGLIIIPNSSQTPTYLVVYRNRNDDVKFMELNPVTARLINLLEEDDTLTGLAAIEQIIEEMNHPNPHVVIKGGHDALLELQSHGILLGTRL